MKGFSSHLLLGRPSHRNADAPLPCIHTGCLCKRRELKGNCPRPKRTPSTLKHPLHTQSCMDIHKWGNSVSLLYAMWENKMVRENPKLPPLLSELLQLIGPCIVKPQLFLLLMSVLTYFCPSISNSVSALPCADILIAVVGAGACCSCLLA